MNGGPRFSTGPEYWNELANDPEVFPMIAAEGSPPFDFTPFWPDAIGIEFDGGGFLFLRYTPALVEMQPIFRPDAGGYAEALQAAISLIFCGTEAENLVCKVQVLPDGWGALLESAGFRRMFRRLGAANMQSGAHDVDYYQLALQDWILGSPYTLLLGQDELPAACDDYSQACFAGYRKAAALHGNHAKGALFYNLWAALTGNAMIQPASPQDLPPSLEVPGNGTAH